MVGWGYTRGSDRPRHIHIEWGEMARWLGEGALEAVHLRLPLKWWYFNDCGRPDWCLLLMATWLPALSGLEAITAPPYRSLGKHSGSMRTIEHVTTELLVADEGCSSSTSRAENQRHRLDAIITGAPFGCIQKAQIWFRAVIQLWS